MLSSKVFFNALLKRKSPLSIKEIARYCSNGGFYDELYPVGKREVVGYAANSMPSYIDRIEYPYPSVRYRETTGDIIVSFNGIKSCFVTLTKKCILVEFFLMYTDTYLPNLPIPNKSFKLTS